MAVRKKAKKKVSGKKVKRKASVKKKIQKTSNKKIKTPVKNTKEKSLGNKIGKVVHYYTNLKVGIIELNGTLKVGDKIKIKGATTDFEQKVASMQIEHDKVEEAKKGKSIGLKVKKHVRENDVVYKLE